MADFMTPPPDAIQSPSGPVWCTKDGIIITRNNFVTHSHEDAIENLRLTRELARGKPRPLLVDITNVRTISKKAREEYVLPGNKEIITAVALITTSNVGRMVGNLFMTLNKPAMPMKMFTNADNAREWLLQYK